MCYIIINEKVISYFGNIKPKPLFFFTNFDYFTYFTLYYYNYDSH